MNSRRPKISPPALLRLLSQTANTVYSERQGCFVHTVVVAGATMDASPVRTRCRGLTRLIAAAWPAPARHPVAQCTFCNSKARGQRQARAKAIGGTGKKNIARPAQVPPAGRTFAGPSMDHGKLVDAQIQRWTADGIQAANATWPRGLDGAAISLMQYIIDTRNWLPVAAQVPLHMPSFGDTATAIDLLCTDAETRTKLYLIEVKSTRNRQPDAREPCYHAAPKPTRREQDAGPGNRSQCQLHQLQLWAMDWTLRTVYGLAPDEALVLRCWPGGCTAYPLDRPWWDARAPQLVNGLTTTTTTENTRKKRKRA